MADGIAQERVAVLMELAGRCLLRYQRIERALKLLLPHLVKPGSEAPVDAPNWRLFLDGRYTLGPLRERFKEGLKADNLENAHAHLERIVSERNDSCIISSLSRAEYWPRRKAWRTEFLSCDFGWITPGPWRMWSF
jgi:hypothetical protein